MSRIFWINIFFLFFGCSKTETLELGGGLQAPQAISFGDCGVGIQCELTFELLNTSASRVTVNIEADDLATPQYEFRFRDSPLSLNAKSSAMVTVTFRAREVMTMPVSSLVRFKNNLGGPVLMTMTGRGVKAMEIEPATVDFGEVRRGEAAERELIIRNLVDTPLPIMRLSPSPPSPGGGHFDQLTQPEFMIPPRSAEVVRARYTPYEDDIPVVADRSTWTFAYCDRREFCSETIELVGQRTDRTRSCLEISPPSIDFGSVALGGSASMTLTISNTCFYEVIISHLDPDGSGTGAFTAEGFSAGTIGVGEYLNILVSFTPNQAGDFASDLMIVSDDAGEPARRVPLFGKGELIEGCTIAFASGSFDFGEVEIMRTQTAAVVIENVSSGYCLISAASIYGSSAGKFALLSVTSTINPGESGLIEISYTPSDYGDDEASLSFLISSGSGVPATAITQLSGIGVAGSPVIFPDRIDFGALSSGCFQNSAIVIFNPRDTPLVIDQIELVSGSSADFTFVPHQLPLTVQPFEVEYVLVNYAPIATKLDSGAIAIREEGHAEPYRVWMMGREGDRHEQKFIQPAQAVVDVVFVIDGNSSMADERAVIESNLQSFIDFANISGYDARISTTTIAGEHLRSTIEELRAPKLLGANSGFLRRDAALAIVFVTDRDDDSPGNFHSYYALEYFRIHGTRNMDALSMHMVTGGPNGCIDAGGEAAAATRLTNVSLYAPGAYESICSDLPAVLSSLATAIFSPRSYFTLLTHPAPGLIEVHVDGVSIPRIENNGQMNWATGGKTTHLWFDPAAVPPPGSEIVVSYPNGCN